MANCQKCGAELFETSKFCPSCGEPVAVPDHVPEETQPDEAAPKEEAETKTEEASVTLEQPEPEQSPAREEPTPEKQEETVYISDDPPKKKNHLGVIIAAAVIAVGAGAVFVINSKVSELNVITETETEAVTAEMTEVTGVTTAFEVEITETSAETEAETAAVTTAVTIESEAVTSTAESSVTETSDVQTSVSETTAAVGSSESESDLSGADISHDLPEEGLTLEPEHKTAMGNSVSASLSLSDHGISADMLTDEVIVIADYTTDAVINGAAPVIMVVTAGETEIQTAVSSSGVGQAYFEYANVLASLSEAGLSPESVNTISFKTTGIPIDVFSVTFIK